MEANILMLSESINTSELVDSVKGEVLVEIFDAETGSLVDSQHSYNFIANSGREYLQYLQRVNFKNQISTLNASSDADPQKVDCFNSIILTDSAMPTSPANEWSVPGNIVGWADKSLYSGPDTLKGSPNATLSQTSLTESKWVFDWPTHSANGSINSVCWAKNVGGASAFMNTSTVIKEQPFPGRRPVAYANSNKIFGGSGTTVSVYNSDLLATSSFTTISCNGIAWDAANSKLWVISGNQIASYSDTGAIIDPPVSVASRSYLGLTFDGTNLWTTVVGSPAIYCLSTSGSDISSFNANLGDSNLSTYWGLVVGRDICWDAATNSLLIIGGYYGRSNPWQQMFRFDVTGNRIGYTVSFNAWNSSGNYNYNYYSYDTYDGTTFFDKVDADTYILPKHTYNTDTLVFLRVDQMGSRFLLPSTITKTDQQTLRVTYQFNYS